MRPEDPKHVTTADMAALLSVSQQTLHRLAALPDCPVVRVGRVYRWPVQDVLAWLKSDRPEARR